MSVYRFCISSTLPLALIALLSACGDKSATTSTAGAASAPASGAIALAAPATPVVSVTPTELMRSANTAFRDGRIAAPAGDNAIELFLAVRDRDARQPGLAEALVELMPLANMAFASALRARDLPEAERMLGLMGRLNADSQTTKIASDNLAGLRTLIAQQEEAKSAAEAANQLAAATIAPSEPAQPAPAQVLAVPKSTPAQVAAARSETTERIVAESEAPAPPVAPAAAAATRPALTPPIAISRVPPEYPAQARRGKVEGFVELEFLVTTSGGANEIRVVRSEPEGLFDRSAVRALMRWKFKPAQRDGKLEAAKTRATVNFKLS